MDYKRLKAEIFKMSTLRKLVSNNEKKEAKKTLDHKSLRKGNDELGYFSSLDNL